MKCLRESPCQPGKKVQATGLALPIPVYARFRARGHPVVGTTIEYFDFRGLEVNEGRMLATLGECLLGAKAAKRLNLKPGNHLVTSPENLFDLAGVYPLKMKVVGVLETSHTSDDLAVFVDVKTAWVIQGLGHGHQDVTKVTDDTLILEKTETNVSASPKLFHYTEISEANIGSFHFHGDTSVYPITAVLVAPLDTKSGTILRGRFLTKEEIHQIVKPEEVIDSLLESIFRIKNVLDAVISVVALATLLAIILVFALSLRLREREIQTIFKLGCRKMTTARLIGAEIFLIVLTSGALCGLAILLIDQFANSLVRMLFIR